MKKIAAIVLTLVFVLSLSVTVFAAGGNSFGKGANGKNGANVHLRSTDASVDIACPYNADCPYGAQCLNNGSCLINDVCPNNGICPNDGLCPNKDVCPNNGSCPNNGNPPRDGTGYKCGKR